MSFSDGPLMRAAAAAFARGVRLRNRFYDRPESQNHVSVPVISVGNLTVGGTGKTPLVAWLAGVALALGERPAVVSRGYGGRAGRGPLVVSDGSGPLLPAEIAGDEPLLLARSLGAVPVIVGSDRTSGAEAAVRIGCTVVILDDGFQHRRLARDLDLVLLDSTAPFGNGRLLPAGPLREPPESLRRADVIALTRSVANDPQDELRRRVRRFNAGAPIVRTGHRSIGFFDPRGSAADSPFRAVGFCGIGNPEQFRRDLVAAGVDLLSWIPFRDHHRYTAREIAELQRKAAARDCALVTTEKDLVRIAPFLQPGEDSSLLTLRIEAEVHDADLLTDLVARLLHRDRT